MELPAEDLREAVHTALRAWHTQSAPPPTLLDKLLLVRTRRMEKGQSTPTARRLATNHVLLEAIDELERQDETAAQILRCRFPEDNTLLRVAHRLNVSEHTVSRLQRAAIEQLAQIIARQEQTLRQARAAEMEAKLPPPTYTRLFGFEEPRAGLQEKRYGIHRLTETFLRTEIIHWPEEGDA